MGQGASARESESESEPEPAEVKGYEYTYDFKLVDMDEITSKMKRCPSPGDYVPPGGYDQAVVLEMRTVFTILRQKRVVDVDAVRLLIDRETFDVCGVFATTKDPTIYHFPLTFRLWEYWMPDDEIIRFTEEFYSFVKALSAQYPFLPGIPVAIDFEVCTIQQPDEPFSATKRRAMKSSKFIPIHLWTFQTATRSDTSLKVKLELCGLPKERVVTVDQGLALMKTCVLCSRGPRIGDQITKLRECGCTYHTACIVRKLEHNNLCPCKKPVYDSEYLRSAPDNDSDCDSD